MTVWVVVSNSGDVGAERAVIGVYATQDAAEAAAEQVEGGAFVQAQEVA